MFIKLQVEVLGDKINNVYSENVTMTLHELSYI